MSTTYDRQGKPLADVEAWAELHSDLDYCRIAETILPDGTWVSTVWLGLDHNFIGGPPLIFETMVFPQKDVFTELDQARYSTEGEAIVGHEVMVAKWTKRPTNEVIL